MNKYIKKISTLTTCLIITFTLVGIFSFVDQAKATHINPVGDQSDYRWRNDNGTEDTATWKETVNTPTTGVADLVELRIRIAAQETAGGSLKLDSSLEFGTNADCTSGSWTPVTTTSGTWQLFDSDYFTEPIATVQRISSASFLAGELLDQTNTGLSVTMVSQGTEHEWAIKANGVAGSTDYYFRVSDGGTALSGYSVCAKLTTAAAAGQTISGRVFTAEGGGAGLDCDPTPSTITLLVNGASPTPVECTDSPSQGSYEFTGITTNATDILTVYVNEDGAGIFGTVVTETAGNDITDLDIYGDHIIVRHDNSGSLTIDDMDNYDSGNDTDIHFTATSGTPDTLTVDDGEELYIWGGDTFAPGGNLTAIDDIQIEGTYTAAGSETITVSGDWLNNSTFTAASSTITMDDTGTFTSGGSAANNLTLSGNGVTLANATHTVAGNLNMSGTVNAGTSTVTMTGAANSIVGGGNTLNILDINPSSAGTITLQTSNLTVADTLTVASGDELAINTVSLTHTDSSDVAGTGTISGTGTLIFDDGSGGPGSDAGITLSSVVRFDASGGNVATGTFDARTYGGAVEVYADTPNARSIAMASATQQIDGNLTVITGASQSEVLTLDAGANPTVNVGGNLSFTKGGSATPALTSGTGTWTVTGNIDLTDGDVAFTAGNIFQVNGTSKTITSAAEIFKGLSVTGTGDVSNVDQLAVSADFSIGATATFTHGTDVDFIATGTGDTAFVIANGGTFDSSGAGAGKLILDGADQSFDDQTDPGEQNMGDVQIGQSPGTTKLKADFAADSLTILDNDHFETHGWDVDIAGAIDCQLACDFDLTDQAPNAAGNPTIVTFGGDWTMSGTGTFVPSTDSQVQPDGAVDQAVATGGKAFWDFYSNNSAGDADDDVIISGTFDVDGDLTVNNGELDLNANNPATDVEGDVIINAGGELNAPSSLNAAGNWNNNGTFTANAGTVTFDDTGGDGAEAIDAGTGNFNIVVFDNAAGSWTIQNDNMTTDGNLTLTAAASFILSAGLTLEVKGDFTLTVSGDNTTWTGSTLYLNGSGGMYEINTKSHGGDVFVTLKVGTTEDIAMWDSYADTTYTIEAGGCLYSQDHEGTGGLLYIDGTCSTRTGGEWWNYADDFDNTPGANRQVTVSMDDGASYTVDNTETLEITGQSASANPTLITRDSTGTYSMTIDGTIDAQYYEFDYADASGLNITATATVTELSNGSFDNAGAGPPASYITVTGITSDDIFRNNIFDDNLDGPDGNVTTNVTADGEDIYWKFLWWDGNLGGEAYDSEANNAVVDWSENLSFSLSANVVNLGVINPLVIGTGNHTITVTTNAINGYTCSAAEDGDLDDITDTFTINDVADNTVEVGQEEYGISCAGADCIDDVNDQAIPLAVVSNNGRVTANVATITYKAAVDALTVGTTFSHIVTYTCAGNF